MFMMKLIFFWKKTQKLHAKCLFDLSCNLRRNNQQEGTRIIFTQKTVNKLRSHQIKIIMKHNLGNQPSVVVVCQRKFIYKGTNDWYLKV